MNGRPRDNILLSRVIQNWVFHKRFQCGMVYMKDGMVGIILRGCDANGQVTESGKIEKEKKKKERI